MSETTEVIETVDPMKKSLLDRVGKTTAITALAVGVGLIVVLKIALSKEDAEAIADLSA